MELATDFYYKEGGRLLCIDEIHRFENWNQELKNIYDSLPDMKVIFSGSSSLNLVKGRYDLSRRGIMYNLPGFSFREYLAFYKNISLKKIDFKDLLDNYQQISQKFIKIKGLLKYFKEYLQQGYYPFYNETTQKELYFQQINSIVDKIIYEDIASFYSLKTKNLIIFKQLLHYLSTITPGEISVNRLASSTKRNYATIFEYLTILEEAGLVRFLTNNKAGHSLLRHAKKVFLDNTNLLVALTNFIGKTEGPGTLRELFVLNQLQNIGIIPTYTVNGDFDVRGYIFEVGGKNKNFSQIKNIKKSFLVLDDIVIGDKHKIPLYLFGFLY